MIHQLCEILSYQCDDLMQQNAIREVILILDRSHAAPYEGCVRACHV
jgi:hypothetical protein